MGRIRDLLFRRAAVTRVADGSSQPADGRDVDMQTVAQVEGAPPASVESPRFIAASTLDDIVRIDEVQDGNFYTGDLFRRLFRSDPPDYGRHFVAFYQPWPLTLWPVGYVHYMSFEDSWMCGGLVIDDRLYRRMPDAHRKVVKSAGGIAEALLTKTFLRLADAPAIWAHVGDTRSEKVTLRAGFRRTVDPHVMVVWNKALSDEEKRERLERVVAFGPF